jgi:hypothetical protein
MVKRYAISLFFFFFFATSLFAGTPSCVSVGSGYTFLQQNGFSGHLGTFQASYIYQPSWQLYAGYIFKMGIGSSSDSDSRKGIFNIDTQERLGYTFGKKISLFSGLGYRYINQKDRWFGISFSTSHHDLYIPIGLSLETAMHSRFQLGISGQWRPQIYPIISLSTREGISWRTEIKLTNFLIEIPLKIKISQDHPFHLVFIPFVDYWQEGKTIVSFKSGKPIPEQTFLFAGIDVDLTFGF